MKFSARVLGSSLLVAVLFSFLALAVGQEPDPSSKKLYRRTGSEATLTGTILFLGEVPEAKRIDVSADPVCEELSPQATTESAIVNNGKLANVFVYIKSGTAVDSYRFEEPISYATLSHKGCRYVPHLLGLRVGQTLLISNEDATIHNTHPNPSTNEEWNQSQAPGAPPIMKTFSHPETFIPFKNNQHPWEKAYVGVFAHPFFAISDDQGSFKIEGLPPGNYTLVAWHERFGEKTMSITISPNESRNIDFHFEASDRR